MKQILALIRQNPFFSAVSVIGTAVSITFVMVIYMVYDIQTADTAPAFMYCSITLLVLVLAINAWLLWRAFRKHA